MKQPTHQTQKEERQWRTTVRLAVVVASLLVLLVVALVRRYFLSLDEKRQSLCAGIRAHAA